MPCDNPRGYVLTIFRRDVDEFVKRHVRIIASIDNRADGYAGVPGGMLAKSSAGYSCANYWSEWMMSPG